MVRKCIKDLLVPILIIACLLGSPPISYGTGGSGLELVIAQDMEQGGNVLYRMDIRAGENFRIAYTHSLEKCPIYEVFRVEKNTSVTQIEEVYGWFAAGLEFNPQTGSAGIGDHGVHIRDMNRNLKEIPIRVGWICNFRLEFKEQVVPLISLAPPGKLVWVKVLEKP